MNKAPPSVRVPAKLRFPLLAILPLLCFPQSAQALLNIDGTRNQVFVFGDLTVGYDSNILAQSTASSDYTTSLTLGTEIKRRAGIISVNLNATVAFQRFSKFTSLNNWNPNFAAEFNKTIGRTTGAFTVSAYRSSKADSAVNLRTSSWNFPLGLSVKYPINDKFYVTSQSTYLSRQFVDNDTLSDYLDYAEGVDLFYIYTSRLDLLGGYRIRVSRTDKSHTADHNINLGMTGGILPKLNGTIRVGYQFRNVSATEERFNQYSISTSLTWNATRKFTVTGSVARDFSTTATAVSVDTFAGTLTGTYVFTRRFQVNGDLGAGRNLFLGRDQPYRRDTFLSWGLGVGVNFNEHLRLNLSYTYMHNWSTLSYSDFERTGYSLDIYSRF